MKIVFGAALALALLAGVASAQTPPAAAGATPPPPVAAAVVVAPSRCAPFPADPTLPEGAGSNARQMQEGDRAYQAWGHAMQAVLECRRAEAEELMVYARQHEARVNEYNAAVSHLNGVGTGWQAQAAAYNARHH